MPTVEERIKQMDAARTEIEPVWNKAIARFQKDIAAPAFKKNGDIRALAHQFDAVQSKFEGTRNFRDDAQKFIDDGRTEFNKLFIRIENLKDQYKRISEDALASTKAIRGNTLEDALNNWDELFKEHRDINRETKNVFDEILKLNADQLKILSETSAKVQAAIKSGNARLAAFNTELNKLEEQIRSTVAKYQKTAYDVNRNDIDDAVRGFLKVFG
jgi:predicted  nucleic acid-binding Zn-ribbon protein